MLHPLKSGAGQVKCRILPDVVTPQAAMVFQLLAFEDQALHVWRDAFFVLELCLHGVNGVRIAHVIECDGIACQGLHEDREERPHHHRCIRAYVTIPWKVVCWVLQDELCALRCSKNADDLHIADLPQVLHAIFC